ncbi:Zinc finger protein 227 [Eumeta japonica]|uniref:Zinc finger protein 227 n=1 Tax=Eumeta variegata TaxID=151549 RepID=A0A4C1UNJ3_EUMVA|nr:Zinc finger protein 227 [Eumeta japonica]
MQSQSSSSAKGKTPVKRGSHKKDVLRGVQHATEMDFDLKPVKTEDFLIFELPSLTGICRVCLKIGNVPIYGSDQQESIISGLETVCGLNMAPNDGMPKYLCKYCHTLLDAAMQFRKTAQETDEILRQTKSEMNNPNTLNDIANDLSDDMPDDLCDDLSEDIDTSFSADISQTAPVHSEKKEKIFECKKCQLQFNNESDFTTHRISDDHKNAKSQCPICKGYYAPLYLKSHMLRHKPSTEKSYICDVCGKTFVIQNAFTRHRLTHGYDLPFKCELCPYRGRFTESLKMHMRSHTGEKPYACSECPRRFISKSNLNKHSLTHKKEHDFKCQDCGRGFYTRKELEMHFKVDHTGIKDHICNICGKAFGYRKQMMKHQKKVHKREKLRSGRMPLYLQVELKKQAELANQHVVATLSIT